MTNLQHIQAPLAPALILGPGPLAREIGSVLGALQLSRGALGLDSPLPRRWVLEDLEDLLSGKIFRLRPESTGAEGPPGQAIPAGFPGVPQGTLAESEGGSKQAAKGMEWSPREIESAPETGVLLLEASTIPLEDIGFIRRFLERCPGWNLVVLGSDRASDPAPHDSPEIDSVREASRVLLRLDRSQSLPWPPNLDQLAGLLELPRIGSVCRDSTSPEITPVITPSASAITSPVPLSSPLPDEFALQDEEASADEQQPSNPSPEPHPIEDQRAPENGTPAAAENVTGLHGEPMDTDRSMVELGGLVEELLASEALSGSQQPRTIFRCRSEFPLHHPRSVLIENLSGMLGLARLAAGNRGVVSVHVTSPADGQGALLRIDFPPGELEHESIDELLRRAESAGDDPADELAQALKGAAHAASELRDLGAEPSLSDLEDGRLRLAVEFPPGVPAS